jgi:hypothetical protein
VLRPNEPVTVADATVSRLSLASRAITQTSTAVLTGVLLIAAAAANTASAALLAPGATHPSASVSTYSVDLAALIPVLAAVVQVTDCVYVLVGVPLASFLVTVMVYVPATEDVRTRSNPCTPLFSVPAVVSAVKISIELFGYVAVVVVPTK